MEEIVVRDKKQAGYDLKFGICTRCGEETAIKVDKEGTETFLNCPICKNRDPKYFKQTEKTITSDKVGDIINREVAYKDPKTGKITKNPFADSPLNEKLVKERAGWKRGWLCTNCRSIYEEKVECCSDGKMISGKYSLDPSGIKRQIMGAM